ncbi:MAG TPA: PLP-dependent aminotransferase family protein, partial [Bryobacteraceae bacterium]|nr:PLP-dependent aminotransferase family protein [Bryobacteraceae bacterium]
QQSAREVLLSAEASRVLQLGAPAGYPALRRWLLERAEAEGSRHANDEVLVTNGCQQGLDLIQRTLAPAGTTAVIEDPVYHGVRNVFARVGVKLAGLPVGSGGVDPEHLARVCETERPAVVVVTPDFQNPCGATMPLEAREAVVQLARKFGFVLVENSIYRETRYIGTALPSLKQLDRDGGTVVSLGSFSKIAFPGLRVGWVLGPGALIARLTEARQWCDLHTDHLSQAILLRFADSGRLSRHVESVRENGRVRLQRVIGSLERHMPSDAAWTRPEGGFNLWLRLPGGLDAADLLPWAEQAGVSYLPGIYFRVGPGDRHALRLSFGALSPESIERGVITLARVCRERLSGRPGDRDVFDAAAAVV